MHPKFWRHLKAEIVAARSSAGLRRSFMPFVASLLGTMHPSALQRPPGRRGRQ